MNSKLTVGLTLLLFAAIQMAHALPKEDICYSNKRKECGQVPYIFKCDRNKCVKHESKCDEYLLLKRHYNSRLFTRNSELAMFSENTQAIMLESRYAFVRFENQIMQKCPIHALRKLKPSWTKNDVCLKRKKCFRQVYHRFSYSLTNNMKTDCSCDSQHRYSCGLDYCTVDGGVCDAINELRRVDKGLLNQIEKCSFWKF